MLQNPVIEYKKINEIECVYFTFKNKFTEQNATDAVKSWNGFLSDKDKKYTYVWNCKEMSGYDPMARVYWQKAIKAYKNQIDKIWLISDSKIIITGANLLSVFTSIDIKAIKSEQDIK